MDAKVKQALVVYSPGCANPVYLDEVLGYITRRLCEADLMNVRVVPLHEVSVSCLLFNYEPLDLIVIAGGDKPVRCVLESLAQTGLKIPVGMIPLGSDTLLAAKLGIKPCHEREDLDQAINTIVAGTTIAMDLGKINGRYFAIDAVIGNIPPVVLAPESNISRHFGVLSHLTTFVQTVGQRSLLCRILFESEGFYRLASSIFVTNARGVGGRISGGGSGGGGLGTGNGTRYSGAGSAGSVGKTHGEADKTKKVGTGSGGRTQADTSSDGSLYGTSNPGAGDSAGDRGIGAEDVANGVSSGIEDLSDGSLYLCIVNPLSLGDYGRLAYRFGAWYLSGTVTGDAPLLIKKMQHVRIETDREAPMMVDGEIWGTTPVDIDVVPGAVTVIVPAQPGVPQSGSASIIRSIDGGGGMSAGFDARSAS